MWRWERQSADILWCWEPVMFLSFCTVRHWRPSVPLQRRRGSSPQVEEEEEEEGDCPAVVMWPLRHAEGRHERWDGWVDVWSTVPRHRVPYWRMRTERLSEDVCWPAVSSICWIRLASINQLMLWATFSIPLETFSQRWLTISIFSRVETQLQ